MEAFYVVQIGFHFQVVDYCTKQVICEVNMHDKEASERWAKRIAKALNLFMPIKA